MTWNHEELAIANTLHDVLQTTISMLKRLRAEGMSIHHVAGAITADGDKHINRNLARLLEWRIRLSAQLGPKAFVFTSPVLFSEALYVRLGTFEKDPVQREIEFQEFWDKLIESNVIDEIHFTPGWERSAGAKREYQTAKKVGLKIHLLQSTKNP